MSRFSKAQFFKNLKKENWKRLNEEVYAMSSEDQEAPESGFADTGIDMDEVVQTTPFHNTTIQFEPEEDYQTTDRQEADCEYVRSVIEGIKDDLDEIAMSISQVHMTEDESTGVVSFNYLFDNHTIVNSVLNVADGVRTALTQIKSALDSQTTEEQQQSAVQSAVDDWADEQGADDADDAVVDLVVTDDEVGQYEDEGTIIDDILRSRGC